MIVFLIVFREHFFEYGIRNSIWLLPFIIAESWLWYWYINEGDLTFIVTFFTRIEGYLTILSLLSTILLSAFLGAVAKEKLKKYKEEVIKLEV